MLGSEESANLELHCDLEPPNKDIIQIESIILIRWKKNESDDEDHEKHRYLRALSICGARRSLPKVRR